MCQQSTQGGVLPDAGRGDAQRAAPRSQRAAAACCGSIQFEAAADDHTDACIRQLTLDLWVAAGRLGVGGDVGGVGGDKGVGRAGTSLMDSSSAAQIERRDQLCQRTLLLPDAALKPHNIRLQRQHVWQVLGEVLRPGGRWAGWQVVGKLGAVAAQ